MANNLPYYGYYKYGVMPWSSPLLYERLNKEVKILSFRGYDHGIQLYNIIKRF
ncbi:hypothetical protein [Rickettsia endosymbiont of Orchestes rusci]|uniref:hypothetical protein n=1 Tax=Rickettsia endosymbiont of Orchestes rusci TaxID=3066250 RepID=UPI00313D695D